MEYNLAEAYLEELFVHRVGNKANDEQYFLGKRNVALDDELRNLLSDYFFSAFKSEEVYTFFHDASLELNEVYHYVTKIFEDPTELQEQSANLAKHLYNASDHPKIKGGEFYVAYLRDCTYGAETVNAVGLFKSEVKDTFLDVRQVHEGFEIDSHEGIHIEKLDKGCLIFQTKQEEGYRVAVVDQTNRSNEAQYWKDEFLKILVVGNEYYQTNEFLGMTKKYITKQLQEDFEVPRADQIDLLNRSVNYFKNHETFDQKEFEAEVFFDDKLIDSFRKFNDNYRREFDLELDDDFGISGAAVKKQARVFKSVLKLDKNFHIYIHGNREMIEQGVDEQGRKYYKIFYEVES